MNTGWSFTTLTPEEYRLIELSMSPAEIIDVYAPNTLYALWMSARHSELLAAFAAWAVWVPEDSPERDTQLFIACVEALRVHLARHGDVLPRRLRKRVAAHVAVSKLCTVKECATWLGQLIRVCRAHSVTIGALHRVMTWLVCEVVYVDDQTYCTAPFRVYSILPNMSDYDLRLHDRAFRSCMRVYNSDLHAKSLWEPSEPAGAAQAWCRLQRVMWPEPTRLAQSQRRVLSASAA